ncbi:aminotransferase class III-fold pyridoxal phosphate-dependent enzyme [Acidisphaera sp. L21]|uniref:aminotransferase class III-fold pyridoxal phosphate-dependent enzyme n=1 Tax=Acidisphaera sp. L21 TaxID=1641851 RepID=UPI001C20310B|nr:aminotransferase class III-fold pyridoxal phosphate-dependent enzyme [Acidisphaera sp. L21]
MNALLSLKGFAVLANLATMVPYAAGSAVALGALFTRGKARLELSRAKHRSLTGHAKMSRRVAGLIPFYEFDETRFFRCDSPTDAVAAQRREGFMALSRLYAERFAKTRAQTASVADGLSDLQFTGAYRVPFQFSRMVRQHLSAGSFLSASAGVTLTDLDGNTFYDLTGAYGVNLFGQDFYKACIAAGAAKVQELGPVLGAYHPVVASNVARLQAISGLDEVSFHMSGTEAVMQAVRLARYHTRRRRLVRFCGAYHGWWGDVQPGVGNPTPARDTLTLSEMSDQTLRVLRSRSDIACVLVNPLQALHPNSGAPADSALVDSGRSAGFDRAAYTKWLHELRTVCDERGIVLIFDEIFVGFRLAPLGARDYFGVQPDMITYGKSLGGGLPVGVLCGRSALMKRYRDDRPVDVCFARGTFNSHPYVMGAMNEFLERLETPEIQALYQDVDTLWNDRVVQLNRRLASEELPVSVANLSSIWTISYTRPSRYNWMLQYYMRAEGLALSWVGTGRLIFSLNYSEEDYAAVVEHMLAACRAMKRDGWWSGPARSNKAIKRSILREVAAAALFGRRPRTSPVSD